MAPSTSVPDTLVDDRLRHIHDSVFASEKVDNEEPYVANLLKTLEDYIHQDETHQSPTEFLRGLLKVYKSAKDEGWSKIMEKLTEDEHSRLDKFMHTEDGDLKDISKDFVVAPSIGVREEMDGFQHVDRAIISHVADAIKPTFLMRTASLNSDAEVEINQTAAPQHGFSGFAHKLAAFLWDHKHHDEVKIWDNVEFQNWGRTIEYTPRYTVWPRSVAGVVNIVNFAIKHNYSVRCSGYRHSWAPIFGRQGQIHISTLDPDRVSRVPDPTSLPLWQSAPTELETIDVVNSEKLKPSAGKTLVRVGTAVTNERLRRWCVKNNKLCLPFNVIMVEMTLGGTNAPICHGAGLEHQTLSDLVRSIEYVDCHGRLQVVTDRAQLRAASGCFGLMGVVTHITLEFSPMTYAQLAPRKMPVAMAVPPPDGYEDKIPPALQIKRTPEERRDDIAAFEKSCSSDYYCEWFWFPYSDQAWVNTWNTTTDGTGVVDFPDSVHIFVQWIGTVLMNVAQYSTLLERLGKVVGVDFIGTTIISRAAMWQLGTKKVKTYLQDGLHFQRAIQNVRVRDIEVEMPIPNKYAGKPETLVAPDWGLVRKAWWDAIIIAYQPDHVRVQPQRMPLEMRVMGDSNVIMAPQRGNALGTCSIEILTLEKMRDSWLPYSQQVLDKWMSYTDGAGRPLRTRPHWAKEWKMHTVDGKPWADRLKEDYKSEIVEFKQTLAAIGKEHGWTLAEAQQRFSNEFFDDFVYGKPSAAAAAGTHSVQTMQTTGGLKSEPAVAVMPVADEL